MTTPAATSPNGQYITKADSAVRQSALTFEYSQYPEYLFTTKSQPQTRQFLTLFVTLHSGIWQRLATGL